jgi:hypothetical protein
MKDKRQLLLTILALMLIVVVILLGLFLSGDDDNSDEDERTQTEEPIETELTVSQDAVAVLVVDVFAPLDDFEPKEPDDENCLITPEGQGHASLQGAGHASLQGAGHASLQGAGDVIYHGETVYTQFGALLTESGGRLQSAGTGQDILGETWMRGVQQWAFEDGAEVLLVGVDTIGYSTAVIAQRIPDALDLLEIEFGLSRFVVNMSFAIVPCESLLEGLDPSAVQGEYRDILEQEFPELAALFDRLVSEGGVDEATALVTVLNLSTTPPEARARVEAAVLDRQTGTTYRERNIEDMGEYLVECYSSVEGISVEQQDAIITPTFDPDTDGKGLIIPECEDPIFAGDPLIGVLREVVVRDVDVEDGRKVINIASAGNSDLDFAFAPAYYPSVVSVSAAFSSLPVGVGAGVALTSNAGEVMMDGVYGHDGVFDVGTSFAAPRLSVEAAFYLIRSGETTCTGVAGQSSPPLAHLGWDNLLRVDAGRNYCQEFNALVP